MDSKESDLTAKIRQQFDNAPYPANPLEQSPKYDYQLLYLHNFVTSYYLRNKIVVETEGKVILDAGCGSGYKSLILAEANPGAKIVGVDISEESVKLARQRLQHHGFENAEFHAISIENLQSLGWEFDYINCDEVLYLLPNMVLGLQAMKSVLKPDGIIRVNLHSSLGRTLFFRCQEVFKMMGLMEDNPRELEIDLLRQTMRALKNEVMLKRGTWDAESAKSDGWLLANFLLLGDKGSSIPEMFAALREADLEFISMVNWRHWDLLNLFENTEDLPAFLAMSLPEASLEDSLHLFTLLHPVHRLLDFWCGHPNQADSLMLSEWTLADWQQARVHLHPQLKTVQVREDLINHIANQIPYEISSYLPLPTLVPIVIESNMAACLLPLWEGACPVRHLVELWLKLRPLHPLTLEPVSEETAFEEVKELLLRLESFIYVLLERFQGDG